MNLQGSATAFIRPTDPVRLTIPAWATGTDDDKFIYRMRKRTDNKFELAIGAGCK